MFTYLWYTFGTKPFRQMYKREVWIFAQCAKEIHFFLEKKEEKIVHTACHNDSSSMSLMFLTPHRKMIGHSQKTCVLWINCSQFIEKETLLFLLCGVASCSIDNLTERGIKCNFSEL